MSGWLDGEDVAGIAGSLADGWIPPSEADEKERVRRLAMRGLFRSPPTIVADRYELRECIGRGGLGTVYRAVDLRLKRDVAIKFARAVGADEADPQRLFAEALMLARLSHPNIVPVLDVGRLGSEIYIAMELLGGVTVEAWGATGRPWRELLQAFRQAGRALEASHRAGVVHGDVKPANMMIDEESHVRVLDFGLAREMSAAVTGTATRARASGTAGFIAPEVYGGRMDERSDQFSFCVSLFRLLYGRQPFDAKPHALAADELHRQTLERARGHGVPRWLNGAILRGLRHDSSERHVSMTALLAALVPPRSRAPWLVGIAAVGALVGAVTMARQDERCRRDEQPLAGIWDDARRDRILAASGNDGIADARAIDAYAAQWSDLRGASCQELESGTISPVLHDLRSRCLKRSRDALSYLLDEVDQPGFSAWNRLETAIEAATQLDTCRDDDTLLEGRLVDNADPELASTIQRGLDAAYIHLLLGDPARYLADVRTIEATFADFERAREQTIWLASHLGSALNQSGRFAEAERVLRRALIAAAAGGRRHDHEGRILMHLSEAVGSQSGRAREAPDLAELALATLEGSERGRLNRPEGLRALALAQLRAGRPEEALASIDGAMAERVNPITRRVEPFQLFLSGAAARQVRGLILEQLGRREEAEHEYRAGLDHVEPFDQETAVEANLCNSLGVLLRHKGQFAEAIALFERASTIDIAAGLHDDAARVLTNLANLHIGAGEPAPALLAFDRALAAQALGSSPATEAEIRFNRAIALHLAGRFTAAVDDYDRVLEIRSSGEHADEGRRYLALVGRGSARAADGHELEARSDFEAALRAETPDADPYSRAELRLGLARTVIEEDAERAKRLASDGHAIAQASRNDDLAVEIDRWLSRQR